MNSNKLLNTPIEKFKEVFAQSHFVRPGMTISYEDEIDYRSEIKAFDYCMKKIGSGHFISPECKPMVLEFEKVNYDLSKLPANMRDNFARTYSDFKNTYSENPSKYKNSSVELYCNIYEMFNNNAITRLMDRVKKSKIYKDNAFAKEGLKGIESLEYYLADNKEQSEELFGTIGTLGANVTTLLGTLNSSLHLLSVILIFVAAAICILCLINIAYNIQLAKNIELLTEKTQNDELSFTQAKNLRIQTSIDNMEASYPMISKVMFFKPMAVVQAFVDEHFVKHYDKFDSELTALEKSKESYDNNEESTEGGWLLGAFLVFCIPAIFGLLRHTIYYVSHLKLRLHLYFKEMGDWTSINVDNLVEKSLDPNTSKEEKARLKKIIEKQKVWAVKLYTWSDKMYKAQTMAGNETRSQIRDDESKNFDKQAVEEKEANKITTGDTSSDTTEETQETPVEETPKPSSGPVAIF